MENNVWIYNEIIVSLLVTDLPPQIRQEYGKDLVFLSQSAMQLCGFSIGFPVLIETSGYNTVLKAWPTIEGSLTSVKVCLAGLFFPHLKFLFKYQFNYLFKIMLVLFRIGSEIRF